MSLFNRKHKKVIKEPVKGIKHDPITNVPSVTINGSWYKFDISKPKGLYLFEKEYELPIHEIAETTESQCKFFWCVFRGSDKAFNLSFDDFMDGLTMETVKLLYQPEDEKK